MKDLIADFFNILSRKGQFKIQQMAFVLLAIIIFFALVTLFYFSIRISDLGSGAEELRETEVKETIRKISSTAEFVWTVEDCASCIDLDKILILKERKSYEGFWNSPFLQISRVYPRKSGECTKQNYPECETITLVNTGEDIISHSAFVSLCRYDSKEDYNKCELGKIIMGFETVR